MPSARGSRGEAVTKKRGPKKRLKSVRVVRPPVARAVEGEIVSRIPKTKMIPPPDVVVPDRLRLRRLAGAHYITSENKLSVYEVWEAFGKDIGIVESTFQHWSILDSWISRRDEYWNTVEARVLHKKAGELVAQLTKDLETLDAVFTTVGSQIQGGAANSIETVVLDENKQPVLDKNGRPRMRVIDAVPKVFDSRGDAIRSMVAVDRRRDEKRRNILGGLPLAIGTGGTHPLDVDELPSISPSVARAMARAALMAEASDANASPPAEDVEE